MDSQGLANIQVTSCEEQDQANALRRYLVGDPKRVEENLINTSGRGSIDMELGPQDRIKKIVQSKSSEIMLGSKSNLDHFALARKKSTEIAPSRNIRQEQLVQLIAGKIREGELLLEASKELTWQRKQNDLSWRFSSRTKGFVHSVLNEITVDIPFDLLKEKIAGRGKSSRSCIARSGVEDISKVCSINHEKTKIDGVDSQDYLLLSLEKEFKDGFFKIAEMSIQDKNCPPLLGLSREQIELRYYQVSHDKEDPKCSKLVIVHSFKLKPQKNSTMDIEDVERKNDLFVGNILREIRA